MEMIRHESTFLLLSICLGMGIRFVYDWLRIIRLVIPHRRFWIYFEDYFFWLCSGIAVFVLTYMVNSGVIRGFSLMGIGLGMLVYHKGPSDLLVYYISYYPRKVSLWLRKKRKTKLAEYVKKWYNK